MILDIASIRYWIKENKRLAVEIAAAILLSTLFFGLGYLVARDVTTRAPIIIQLNNETNDPALK